MSPVSGDIVRIGARSARLGALINSGGAGSVYLLPDDPRSVAKIYHARVDPPSYTDRIEAMLELRPQLPDQIEGGKRYVQIAWPDAVVRDERGRFAGFAMPALDVQSTSELEQVLQERQARAAGLATGLGAKITLAANLCAVLAALHAQHHCVIDLKPVNLRFYRASLYIALLDCDGFSIQGRGRRFAAPQYTPDYLAPEYQGRKPDTAGEEAQDRFALAVVVFQLLNFGIHPFTGRPASDRVPTDIAGRIRERCYAYGLSGSRQIAPSPGSGHASMPQTLRELFDAAFAGEPAGRPSALQWSHALRGYAQRNSGQLLVCADNREHQHYAGMPCASCVRERLLRETARKARPRPRPSPAGAVQPAAQAQAPLSRAQQRAQARAARAQQQIARQQARAAVAPPAGWRGHARAQWRAAAVLAVALLAGALAQWAQGVYAGLLPKPGATPWQSWTGAIWITVFGACLLAALAVLALRLPRWIKNR